MITLLFLALAFIMGVMVGMGANRVFCDYHHNRSHDDVR